MKKRSIVVGDGSVGVVEEEDEEDEEEDRLLVC
jgi:hypothetical protein